jgi:uncharacterized protein YjiS (DUF1127 family)
MLSLLKSMLSSMKKNRDFKKTLKELSRLSNRELEDIGLNRSLLTRTAYESIYGSRNEKTN